MAEATLTFGGDFTGEAVAFVAGEATLVFGGDFGGDAVEQFPANSLLAFGGNFFGEPESAVDLATQRVIPTGFAAGITLSTFTGLVLELTYTEGDQLEDLTRRYTKTETLDTGVHFYDGGFSHGDRTLQLTQEGTTRDQVDIAKTMVQVGQVQVAFWEGLFEGYATSLEVRGENMSMDVEIVRKLSDE